MQLQHRGVRTLRQFQGVLLATLATEITDQDERQDHQCDGKQDRLVDHMQEVQHQSQHCGGNSRHGLPVQRPQTTQRSGVLHRFMHRGAVASLRGVSFLARDR